MATGSSQMVAKSRGSSNVVIDRLPSPTSGHSGDAKGARAEEEEEEGRVT